mmetsp:Transcript_26035/g.72637  ORF Transcript_26035/g.72637 Transcript_26035/m.72637 type:complete len:351 (-) Transcript_26035:2568-3620(-)
MDATASPKLPNLSSSALSFSCGVTSSGASCGTVGFNASGLFVSTPPSENRSSRGEGSAAVRTAVASEACRCCGIELLASPCSNAPKKSTVAVGVVVSGSSRTFSLLCSCAGTDSKPPKSPKESSFFPPLSSGGTCTCGSTGMPEPPKLPNKSSLADGTSGPTDSDDAGSVVASPKSPNSMSAVEGGVSATAGATSFAGSSCHGLVSAVGEAKSPKPSPSPPSSSPSSGVICATLVGSGGEMASNASKPPLSAPPTSLLMESNAPKRSFASSCPLDMLIDACEAKSIVAEACGGGTELGTGNRSLVESAASGSIGVLGSVGVWCCASLPDDTPSLLLLLLSSRDPLMLVVA